MMVARIGILLLGGLLLAACAEVEEDRIAVEEARAPLSDGWLGSQPNHDERFLQLEAYLGGFSSAMWEVGERYRHLHQALVDGNLALAEYHFDKIGSAIRNGYRKRPARRGNADAIFLEVVAEPAAQAFAGDDQAAAWEAFESVRAACLACHIAEDVAFMNEQPLLEDLRAP